MGPDICIFAGFLLSLQVIQAQNLKRGEVAMKCGSPHTLRGTGAHEGVRGVRLCSPSGYGSRSRRSVAAQASQQAVISKCHLRGLCDSRAFSVPASYFKLAPYFYFHKLIFEKAFHPQWKATITSQTEG